VEDKIEEERIFFRNRDRSCSYYKDYNDEKNVEGRSDYDEQNEEVYDDDDDNNNNNIPSNIQYDEYIYNNEDEDEDYDDDYDEDDDDDDDKNDKTDVGSMTSNAPVNITKQKHDADSKGVTSVTKDKISSTMQRERCLMRMKMNAFSVVDRFPLTDNTIFSNDYHLTMDSVSGCLRDPQDAMLIEEYDDPQNNNGDDNDCDAESADDGASDNNSNNGSQRSDDSNTHSITSVNRLFMNNRLNFQQTTEEFMKKYKVPHVHFFNFVKNSLLKMMRPRYDACFSWKDRNITKRLHLIVMLMPYVYTHNMGNLIYYELIKYERFSDFYEGLKVNSLFGIFVYLQFCTEAQLSFILETLENYRDRVTANHRDLIVDQTTTD